MQEPRLIRAVNVLIVAEPAVRDMLDGDGYAIIEAGSGAAALDEITQQDFALLLIDSLDLVVRAREHKKQVPILFVTRQPLDSEAVVRCYRAGAADVLVEPLVPEIVRAKVSVFAELSRQRMQIESSLREKEVLLREIHHRVKNNLQIISSLLNLQASRQTADVKPLFVETNARVRSIALVHEQLHRTDDFAAIDINGYLTSLTSGLLQTYGTLRTDVNVHTTPTAFTIDVAIPCGLIVNELVSNALKYAFPNERNGRIAVTLSEDAESFTLAVCDDGVGIPESVDIERAPTMGLQLVRSLAQQLDGTIELERDHGTRVRIRFPRH